MTVTIVTSSAKKLKESWDHAKQEVDQLLHNNADFALTFRVAAQADPKASESKIIETAKMRAQSGQARDTLSEETKQFMHRVASNINDTFGGEVNFDEFIREREEINEEFDASKSQIKKLGRDRMLIAILKTGPQNEIEDVFLAAAIANLDKKQFEQALRMDPERVAEMIEESDIKRFTELAIKHLRTQEYEREIEREREPEMAIPTKEVEQERDPMDGYGLWKSFGFMSDLTTKLNELPVSEPQQSEGHEMPKSPAKTPNMPDKGQQAPGLTPKRNR